MKCHGADFSYVQAAENKCERKSTGGSFQFISCESIAVDIYPLGVYVSGMKTCECVRHKKRTEEEKKDLLVRLKKAEGQIRGIEKMVEEDIYCPDILIQVSAVTSALNSFNKQLLSAHIRGCVAEDIRAGDEASTEELVKVLQKLMR